MKLPQDTTKHRRTVTKTPQDTEKRAQNNIKHCRTLYRAIR